MKLKLKPKTERQYQKNAKNKQQPHSENARNQVIAIKQMNIMPMTLCARIMMNFAVVTFRQRGPLSVRTLHTAQACGKKKREN